MNSHFVDHLGRTSHCDDAACKVLAAYKIDLGSSTWGPNLRAYSYSTSNSLSYSSNTAPLECWPCILPDDQTSPGCFCTMDKGLSHIDVNDPANLDPIS